jgi:galactokinase
MTRLRRQVDRITAAFRERAGRPPEGVWSAPGRVNLIGEHTDYNDGFVLPVAIDRRVLAAAARRPDDQLRLWSLQEPETAELRLADLGPGQARGWAAYPTGVAWALAKQGVPLGGVDLLVDGDIPEGSGLSSSAALECAVALALAELYDASLEPTALALAAQRAEVEAVGVPVGVMDQMASMLGRAGHALFLDTRSLQVKQVPFTPEDAGLRLLVLDTRAPRRLVEGAYADPRAACQAAAHALGVAALRDATPAQVEAAAERLGEPNHRRARHVVTENARVLEATALLRKHALAELGPPLNASHASLRDDFEVSSPELDTAVEAALAAGAVGAHDRGRVRRLCPRPGPRRPPPGGRRRGSGGVRGPRLRRPGHPCGRHRRRRREARMSCAAPPEPRRPVLTVHSNGMRP